MGKAAPTGDCNISSILGHNASFNRPLGMKICWRILGMVPKGILSRNCHKIRHIVTTIENELCSSLQQTSGQVCRRKATSQSTASGLQNPQAAIVLPRENDV